MTCHVMFCKVLTCLCLILVSVSFGGLRVEDDADAWLGEFPAGESRETVFTLRNGGAETDRVRALSRSCDCADVSASTNAVAPGASATVTVRVRPRQEPGPSNVSVYVVTFSRDPASRVVKLTVSGRAVPRNRNRLAREAERWQNSSRQVNSATQSAR